MIRAAHLTRRFGPVLAVEDVSFVVERGRVAGFLGPNGAGKTTTMRMLAGLIPPCSGGATIAGHDAHAEPARAHQALGWLPDGAPAPDLLRVDEYLRFRAKLYGCGGAASIERVIDRCGLQDVRRRVIGQLSRGYRQRVGLAAAIVHDPPALILDEPGTGLDPVQQQAFRQLIRDLAEDRAILFSTHQLAEATALCDDLLLIARGRMIASGPLDSFVKGTEDLMVMEAAGVTASQLQHAVEGCLVTREEPREGGWRLFELTCAASAPADVAHAVHALGGKLRRLEPVSGSLESAVHALMEGAGR